MKRSMIHVAVAIGIAVMTGGCLSAPSPVARDAAYPGSYPIVGTGQLSLWDTDGRAMAAPAMGEPLCGQDAQHPGTAPSYNDNGDGTVTDKVTGLMWTQTTDLNWDGVINKADKLNHAQAMQSVAAVKIGGYSDWRLPNSKELQSLVDYSRSPTATRSAAIDPLFSCTGITNEAGNPDWPCYWSSTSHLGREGGEKAVYLSFGRAMGKKGGLWGDVHGSGAQRSDPKVGSAADFPDGRGPQGDAIRIQNFVRLVRDSQEGK